MTYEESKILWKLEKEHISNNLVSKQMKKLYDRVDELITTDKLTYQDFTNDMIDATTDILVDTKEHKSRVEQINKVCEHLYDKYTKQYNDGESGIGDTEVLVDCTALQDTEGLCESVDTTESC